MESGRFSNVCFAEERMCIPAVCVFMTVWFFKDRYENPPHLVLKHSGSVSAEWWMMSSSVANSLKLWFECRGLKNKITFNGHSLLCRIKHELDTSVEHVVSLKPLWLSHILSSCGKIQSINDSQHKKSHHSLLWANIFPFLCILCSVNMQ